MFQIESLGYLIRNFLSLKPYVLGLEEKRSIKIVSAK